MSAESKPQPNDHHSFQDDQSDVQVVAHFDDMPLKQKLLRGIYSYGFEKPSAIQQRAIIPLIQGKDIIAQAQSGTGKTGAFTIGLLERVNFRIRELQALVLSPTRELAQQTYRVIDKIGTYLMDGDHTLCQVFVGGTITRDDLAKMSAGVVVAVGTPGRVHDVFQRFKRPISKLEIFILDEADEMLSQGFMSQVHKIFNFLPRDVQVALFSATLPAEVLELTTQFMREPTRILVKRESLTLEGIKQFYVSLEEEQKIDALIDLYESVSIAQSVIFANTRRKVMWISDYLNKMNHTVSSLHAEMEKSEREKIMDTFRSGTTRVLVTTDLVARGIDVHHVNIVINFDLPVSKENYLHRIGRGGRYGRKGVAINFVSPADVPLLKEIEAHYQTQIEELPQDFATHLSD